MAEVKTSPTFTERHPGARDYRSKVADGYGKPISGVCPASVILDSGALVCEAANRVLSSFGMDFTGNESFPVQHLTKDQSEALAELHSEYAGWVMALRWAEAIKK